jgi:hypothetical protein
MAIEIVSAVTLTIYLLSVIFQAYVLVRKEKLSPFILYVALYSMLSGVLLWGMIAFGSSVFSVFLICTGLFILLVFATYGVKILPGISEESLLVYTVLFWVAYLGAAGSNPLSYLNFITILALIPTVTIIYVLITTVRPDWSVCTLLYVWFMVIQIFLILPQIFNPISLEGLNVEYILTRVSTGILGFNFILYLFILILLPLTESVDGMFEDSSKRDDGLVGMPLADNLSEEQIKMLTAFLIVLTLEGSFLIFALMKISDHLFISFWVIAYGAVQSLRMR